MNCKSNRNNRCLAGMIVFVILLLVCPVMTVQAADWAAGIKNTLNPVKTQRDEKGVWFITGEKTAPLYDVFEAMGYAVATDRLWQAEKYRRMGTGRLAEIFGPDLLESDIQVRTTGYSLKEFEDGFNALDQETKDVINGYVAGFNRRITEVTGNRALLPFEFKAMSMALGRDFVPEPWTYVDVLAWATNMLRFFDGEGTEMGQIKNLGLFQTLQAMYPEDYLMMFQDLRWLDDPDSVTYIEGYPNVTTASAASVAPSLKTVKAPRLAAVADRLPKKNRADFNTVARCLAKRHEAIVASLKKINAYVKIGSYAWVVSGDKTASGNPILYSGPQMDHAFDFSVPSIVTEGSINAGGLTLSGMTIPGMPAIVIGRTPHHAWSMQVGHAHTLDYFIDDPSAVSLHRVEIIKVAGQEDVQLPVYRTKHGPVINQDPVISWNYAHWGKEFGIVGTYLDLARAMSMDEFDAAIKRVTLSQHYCYADRDGNIAYWMSGFNPVRAPGADPRFPQMGGLQEWPEPVTYHPVPSCRNNPRGFYSGWNSKSSAVLSSNSANCPSYYFGPFHRGHILEDYLSTHSELTFENVRDLARYIATTDSVRREYLDSDLDTYGDGGNPWKFVRNDFIAAVNASPTPGRNAVIAMLEAWDGHFVSGGEANWSFGTDRADAWIIMNEWISQVLKLTFADELGWEDGQPGAEEDRIVLFNVLLHAMPGYPTSITTYYDWFSNTRDPAAPSTMNDIIVAALDDALEALGDQPWGTDRRGTITYTHEMLGPVHTLPTSSRSTYAHCIEYGTAGPVRLESMLPLGQSGTILMGATGQPVFDPNFFTMAPVYDGFQHRPFPVPK